VKVLRRWRRRRKREGFEIDLDVDLEPALLVALLVVLAAMACLDRPLIAKESIGYLVWLDSIALDGDLDLANQAVKLGMISAWPGDSIRRGVRFGGWTETSPLGTALLLVPFYRLAAWLNSLPSMQVNDGYFLSVQGVPFAYSLCVMLGVNLYTLVTVVLGYGIARRFASPRLAALAVVAVCLGTPLLYYSTVEPLSSHATGAFSLTLFVFLWLRARARRPRRTWRDALPWLWTGLAAGLAVMCRWQVALALAVAAELLLHGMWRKVLLFVGGFLLLAWLVPYSWWLVVSAPWDVLLAVRAVPARVWSVLASPVDGLFVWSPVTLLAMVGLWPLLRRDWRFALIVGLTFVLQVLVSTLVSDPEGDISFGVRRMADLYPLYVLSLVTLLEYLALHERGASALAQGLVGACAVYGVVLLLAYLGYRWAAPADVSTDASADVLETLRYGLSPAHWPRMWMVLRDRVGVWAWKKPGM
jgi:hypothetical protein